MTDHNKSVHSPPTIFSCRATGRMPSRTFIQATKVDPPYSITTTNNPSCSSLVSAITLDEDTFGQSVSAPPPHRRESTRNASFDITPLLPVREPSFSSSLGAQALVRHSADDALPFSAVTSVCRFDLVCQTSTAELYAPPRVLGSIKKTPTTMSSSTCKRKLQQGSMCLYLNALGR
jgi:hypothetical protein